MRTIRRLVYAEVVTAVAFVTLGFLALFFFFDLVDELPAVGRGDAGGYTLVRALSVVALTAPNRLYELMPITVLIGTILVMARMAQNSEFTILRTSGLGPWRALRVLLALGCAFTFITFAVGEYVAPLSDRMAQLIRTQQAGGVTVGQTGAWIRERRPGGSVIVNVAGLMPDGSMRGVRIIEFDDTGAMKAEIQAPRARFATDGHWLLEQADLRLYPQRATGAGTTDSLPAGPAAAAAVELRKQAEQRWSTGVSSEMVSTALFKPQRMGTIDLFRYMRHLAANGQTSQRYEIEFWRKVFYPLSCLVMVVMALPFAYLHFRNTSIATLVFGGVLLGVSFFLLNNVFGYVGTLRNWVPWVAAAIPGVAYSVLSLTAFGWLVLRR